MNNCKHSQKVWKAENQWCVDCNKKVKCYDLVQKPRKIILRQLWNKASNQS